MRAIFIRLPATVGLLLATCLPGVAAAESVTVIRGSEVSVVEGPDGFAREAKRAVASVASRRRRGNSSRSAPADRAPKVVIVYVDLRDDPQTAWALVSPWSKRGIKVHRGRGGSRIITHRSRFPRVSQGRTSVAGNRTSFSSRSRGSR